MIVVCPSCDTHFTLPPSALGPGGRALRCARCGHKWHATQSDVLRADPAAKKNKAPPPPAKPAVQPPAKSSAEPPAAKPVKPVDPAKARAAAATVRDDIPLESPPPRTARDDDLDLDDLDLELGGGQPGRAGSAVDFGKIPAESAGTDAQQEKDEGEDPFARISELMMSSPPEPIPDVFASPPPKRATRRKGAAGLWLLLFVLLLSSLGAGAYFLQDRLIDKFP
ncbi:MAG TPA: hypothetical protein HPP80_06250, partial [Rhodospirillaceae bacterium]|nr:hypothetical protein [Rhodospirillaceae bacterium]